MAPKTRALWMGALALATLGWSEANLGDRLVGARDAELKHAEPHGPRRRPVRGSEFPKGVLALTWDDGPDVGTLELAHYLHDAHVSGTFFVVAEWIDGVSEEPGIGSGVFETGYRHLPVLEEVVGLGHRLGNHTANHVLLDGPAERELAFQLVAGQRAIEPFEKNELPLFRTPGGAWSRAAASVVEASLPDLVGPIHWDIDAKDWEGSRYCHSESPPTECEPAAGTSRTRPEVIAHRYVERAEKVGRGIVLLHDRVGHVGSRYALDVAKALVPELVARGFVFAAPVLAFGPLKPRAVEPLPPVTEKIVAGHASQLGDLNGDGLVDACFGDASGVWCALADGRGFKEPSLWAPPHEGALHLADVNGDGRADLCFDRLCGLAP